MSRRTAASALLAGAPALWPGRAAAQGLLRRATPAPTEGLFYPTRLPPDTDFDLLRNGTVDHALGRPAWVSGTVTDLQVRPLRGGLLLQPDRTQGLPARPSQEPG